MSWLDVFFIGVSSVAVAGTTQPKETTLNLIAGTGMTIVATDNPSNRRTDITLSSSGGGSGITQLTGDVTAGPGSGSQAATVAQITGSASACNVVSGTVLTFGTGTMPSTGLLRFPATSQTLFAATDGTNTYSLLSFTNTGQLQVGASTAFAQEPSSTSLCAATGGNVFVTLGGATVASFSTASGTSNNLMLYTTTVPSNLWQQDIATNSATGQTFTIHAQNSTGTTSTGGLLALSSGTGTTSAGNVELQTGGTAQWRVTPSALIAVNSNPIQFGTATVASSGLLRFPNTTQTIFAAFNGVSNDYVFMSFNAAGTLNIGTDTAFTAAKQVAVLNLAVTTGSAINFDVGSTTWFIVDSASIKAGAPYSGYAGGSKPFQLLSTTITSASSITLSASQYACPVIFITGSTAGTITFPNNTDGFWWLVNQSTQTQTLTCGAGGNVTVATLKAQMVRSDGAGKMVAVGGNI